MAGKSFVEYSAESDFPIENIPFGVFRKNAGESSRCASIIGEFVVDLFELASAGLLQGPALGDGSVFKSVRISVGVYK